MKRVCGFVASMPLAFTVLVAADTELRTGCTAHFTTADAGAEILAQNDDFVQRLSPFDRASRMKTDKSVSEKEFLAFLKGNVLSWNEIERSKIEATFATIRPALERLPIAFPKRILFVKTTGEEEGHAFYTRDTAIMMPEKETARADTALLRKTITHELFHILSRYNPAWREKLYESIGFTKCGEVEFPSELKPRKITNPDAPRNDHAIQVQVRGKAVRAVPILFSNMARYDTGRGGEFFNYLQFRFLLLTKASATQPQLVTVDSVSGFFEQVGRNTSYVIHPEEILADNFVLLMLEEHNVASPEVLEKIRRVLEQK